MSQDYSHVRAELLSLMLKFWLSPNAGAWGRMSNFLSRSISFSGPRCQWKRILSVLSSQDKEERRKWPTGRPLAEASAVEEISLDGVYCDSVTQHSLLQNHVPISLACFTNISGNLYIGWFLLSPTPPLSIPALSSVLSVLRLLRNNAYLLYHYRKFGLPVVCHVMFMWWVRTVFLLFKWTSLFFC